MDGSNCAALEIGHIDIVNYVSFLTIHDYFEAFGRYLILFVFVFVFVKLHEGIKFYVKDIFLFVFSFLENSGRRTAKLSAKISTLPRNLQLDIINMKREIHD